MEPQFSMAWIITHDVIFTCGSQLVSSLRLAHFWMLPQLLEVIQAMQV